jgi:colicin import membrane protein
MTKEITMKKPFFLWSCILHVSILLFLILSVSLSGHSAPSSSSQPNIIHATVINSQALTQYQNAIAQQKLAKQQAIQKIQNVLKAEQAKKVAEQQAAELATQKAAAEKLAAEKMAVEKAAAAKAAVLRQSIEKQLKASMEKQLAKSTPTPVAAKPTQTTHGAATTKSTTPSTTPNPNAGLADKYKSMIIQAISEQWIVPQNLPKNISCVLNVRVAPGGVVLQVSVAKSSGNPVLDNSAIAAVNKASPLPVPTDSNLFDAFRTLKLTVKPDGFLLED